MRERLLGNLPTVGLHSFLHGELGRMDQNPRKEALHYGQGEEREDCVVSVWSDFKAVMGQGR